MAKKSKLPRKTNYIKKAHAVESYTKDEIIELKKCGKDFIYFATKYCYVQHPSKGKVPFLPYDYQYEVLRAFTDHKHLIFMCGRQLGKTTCAALYILWRAVFHNDQTILIASNKNDGAIEVIDRIKYAYENLPSWLKPGVEVYNRRNIVFDNNSEIITRATTKDTGRGLSISLLYCDEFAAVDPPKKQREFWAAIRPTIATGGDCIITSTPQSDEDTFAQIWFAATDIYDAHGNENPGGLGKNGFKAIKFTWEVHPDRDEAWADRERSAIGLDRFKREHECEFLTDSATLIDPIKLATISGIEPKFATGHVRWYKEPEPNKTYLVAMDPSMGADRDYAAIQIFQIPELIQIGEWRHNKTPIHGHKGQVSILMDILKYIYITLAENPTQLSEPDIYWTIEANSIGEAANAVIVETGEETFPGVYLSEPIKNGQKRRVRKGYYTTNKNKLQACARFKSLVERDKMVLNSKPLISELKNYISRGASYAAKGSETDDLVSSCLLITRMIERIMKYDEKFEEEMSEALETEGREPLGMVFLSNR